MTILWQSLVLWAGPASWFQGHNQSYLQQAQVCQPRIWLLIMQEGSRSGRIRSESRSDGS